MNLRTTSGALTLITAITLSCRQGDAADAAKPNILLILADDLGFSDLGCYGGEIRTPHLDRLAENGLRFTQFYNTARCSPTRAALLTGYYAQQVGRDRLPGKKKNRLRPVWARLLPEVLRPLGYRSYHSGKWHLDGKPLENGFDRSYLLRDQNRFFSPQKHLEDDQELPPVERGSGYYATIAIADHAVKSLKEHAAKHRERPFFHYLAFTAPHFPLHALPEDIARYRETYRRDWSVVRRERWVRLQKLGIVRGVLPPMERDAGPPNRYEKAVAALGPGEVTHPLPWSELSPEQQEFQATKMAIHAAMVDRMDREIGRVLAQLHTMGVFENTLIIFLSDNGASAEIIVRSGGHDRRAAPGSAASHLCLGPGGSTVANTPFRRHKVWVHEGGICTPLILHWPRGIAARGELRHNPGHVIDVVPTLLELVRGATPEIPSGAPAPPGRSLVPTFTRDGTVSRESLWWYHARNRAIRVGDWKLVAEGEDGPWELYDLRTDRTETTNLAASKPAKVRELAGAWKRQLEEIRVLANQRQPAAGAR